MPLILIVVVGLILGWSRSTQSNNYGSYLVWFSFSSTLSFVLSFASIGLGLREMEGSDGSVRDWFVGLKEMEGSDGSVRDRENQRNEGDCTQPDPPDQPAPATLTRPTWIPDRFADFTVYCGLEFSKPHGHGSGGQMGRNPPEPTRA